MPIAGIAALTVCCVSAAALLSNDKARKLRLDVAPSASATAPTNTLNGSSRQALKTPKTSTQPTLGNAQVAQLNADGKKPESIGDLLNALDLDDEPAASPEAPDAPEAQITPSQQELSLNLVTPKLPTSANGDQIGDLLNSLGTSPEGQPNAPLAPAVPTAPKLPVAESIIARPTPLNPTQSSAALGQSNPQANPQALGQIAHPTEVSVEVAPGAGGQSWSKRFPWITSGGVNFDGKVIQPNTAAAGIANAPVASSAAIGIQSFVASRPKATPKAASLPELALPTAEQLANPVSAPLPPRPSARLAPSAPLVAPQPRVATPQAVQQPSIARAPSQPQTTPTLPGDVRSSQQYGALVSKLVQKSFHYPEELQRKNISGDVQLGLILNNQGQLQNTVVLTSSGSAQLDTMAQRTVSEVRFPPAPNGVDESKLRYSIWLKYRLKKNLAAN